MRILVLTPTYLPVVGGAEIGIYEIYRRLDRGHDVLILSPHPDMQANIYAAGHNGLDLGPPVHHFEDKLNFAKLRGRRLTLGVVPPFSWSFVWAAEDALAQFQPDVVNVHYAIPTGWAALHLTRSVPVVLSLVGRDIPAPGVPFFWRHYVRKVVSWVDRTIYISEFGRHAVGGPDRASDVVIPYGVDTERFHPNVDGSAVRSRFDIEADQPVLFALQRLHTTKRVDIVIKSLSTVLTHSPNAVLLVGGKGAMRERLQRIAQKTGVANHVRFTGFIPNAELPHFFAAADVFVLHSLYETFGVVLAQALAAGKPIVSVRATAIPELVTNNAEGILVSPLSPELMGRAITEILGDRERYHEMSRNARKKGLLLDWDGIATRYGKVLTQAAMSRECRMDFGGKRR